LSRGKYKMPITREQAIEELKRRGIDTTKLVTPIQEQPETLQLGTLPFKPLQQPDFSQYSPDLKIKSISKASAYHVLKERGMSDDDITKRLNPETKTPDFWKSLVEEIPEYGGALLGGLTGAPGGPLTAIGGAGLGGAAGVAIKQLGKRAFGDPEVPETALEAGKEIGVAGVKQAAYEAGGRLIVGTVGKVLAPFKKSIIPEAEIAQKTLEKYMPKETSSLRFISKLRGEKVPALLPSEVTQNRTLDILANIAEGSLVGGKKIADYKTVIRPEAISNMVDDLINQFGQRAEPDLVGEAFTMAVEKRLKPSRLVATTLYNTVDDMTKDLFISKPITKKVATGILDKSGREIITDITKVEQVGIVSLDKLKEFAKPLAKIAKDVEGIEAKNAGDDLIQAIMSLDNNVSFATAKELRSRLISRIDEFSIINKKAPAIGKAKRAISLIDEATGKALSEHNPEALQVWRQANKLYREGSEQFDNEFIRRLIKQSVDKGNPEVIAKQIFKPGAISNIKKAKNAIDEPTWRQLKSWYVQDILKKSATTEGELSGKAFVNQLTGKTGMGEQALKEIFKPEELTALKNTATALQIATKKQAEGTGRMWIQLTQATAVVGLVDERTRPYSMIILGGPAVLSRLFTNPIAARWLIQGASLPAKSPQAMAILTKLGGLATEIEQDMKRKGEIPVTSMEIQQQKGVSTIKPPPPSRRYNPATGELLEAR